MDVPPPSDGSSGETYHRGRKRAEALLAAAVLATAVGALLRWRPFRVEVSGDSMAPALAPGDWVLAAAAVTPRRGDILVIEHPSRPGLEMVKRVRGIAGDLAPDGRVLGPGELWMEGDDRARSTDSRHFGPVDHDGVRGKVRLVYWPPSRFRIVSAARA